MKWTKLHEPLSSFGPFILTGHLYFFAMLGLSLWYYQERMLAMDTAYYAFSVIARGDFYTGHERTISYIPQVFPLLAVQLGWSLKSVLMAYSAGFVLFYYSAYCVVVHLFRNPSAGLLLALALGLTIRYKFYGPAGEVVLALVPLVILLAWLSKPKPSFVFLPPWLDVVIGIGIGTLLLTTHPFITIATALAFIFLLLWQREWLNPRFWLVGIVTGGLLLKKFVLAERNAYEAERADRLSKTWEVLSNLNDYYISEVIWRYFDTQYALPFIVFLLSLAGIIWSKRIGVALYLLLSFIVLLAIIIVMHAYMTSNIFMMLDGYLSHLGFIWGLPLAFHWVQEKRPWMLGIIIGLLIFSLARIADSSRFFQNRLAYVQRLLTTQTSTAYPKGVVYLTGMKHEKLWIGWSLGVETLMLSSLDGPEYSRNIYMADKPGDLDGRFQEGDLFLGVPFGPEFIERTALPCQYFDLPALPYREVEWIE